MKRKPPLKLKVITAVITLQIDDSKNLLGKIGYYYPTSLGEDFKWSKVIGLDWDKKYKFYLNRTRDPYGNIYLNMYIMYENENILASDSIFVNNGSNHPYIMVELMSVENSNTYYSIYKYTNICPIDIIKTDGTIHRWKYSDGANPWENDKEQTDDLITMNDYEDANGNMGFTVTINTT